jgi:hypothetical protein
MRELVEGDRQEKQRRMRNDIKKQEDLLLSRDYDSLEVTVYKWNEEVMKNQ